MNRIALKRAPGLLGRRSITVIEMKNSTSYGTLMAASSNNYEDTVYNPATLGKMKESSEWKTMVKFRLTSFVTLSAHAGYCVAGYPFVLSDFALLSAGTFLCSCSANVWNQLQEFPFDSQMDRTKSRPFIKKEISNLTGVKWGITMGVGGTAVDFIYFKMKYPRKTPSGKLAKAQGKISRLYVKGTVLGYKRGQNNQYPNTSLIKIQGVDTKEETDWYCGKKLAYVYRAQTPKNGSKFRVIWGKVRRAHGVKGVVRCRFSHNLPPKSFGARVRVMLYPSNI